LINKTGGLNSTNHLEKFKLTTLKSKLKAFREADFTVKQDDEGKLASKLKRTMPKTSKQSIGELSPLKPALTNNEEHVPEDPRLIKKVVPLKFILNDGFSKPNERYMKVKIESRSASREGAILAQIKII
jgi:hypothetical protein